MEKCVKDFPSFLWVTSPPHTSQKMGLGFSMIPFGKFPFLTLPATGVKSLYNIGGHLYFHVEVG